MRRGRSFYYSFSLNNLDSISAPCNSYCFPSQAFKKRKDEKTQKTSTKPQDLPCLIKVIFDNKRNKTATEGQMHRSGKYNKERTSMYKQISQNL